MIDFDNDIDRDVNADRAWAQIVNEIMNWVVSKLKGEKGNDEHK